MGRIILPAVLCTIILSSCALTDAEIARDGGYAVYRPSRDSSEMFDVRDESGPDDGDVIEFLYHALLSESDDYYSPLPDGTRLLSYCLRDGELILYLSGEYTKETDYARVVSDYCLTLTFCGVNGIESMAIYSGTELAASEMRPDDAVYEDYLLPPGFYRLRLFYPDESGNYLRYEYVEVEENNTTLERRVMELLRAGPQDMRSVPALPEKAEVFSASTDKYGVCTINLSAGFFDELPESELAEKLRLYSVVNSLCSLSWVNSVRFLVDGRAVDVYASISLAEPLVKNDDIIFNAFKY